jgi:L-serine deaminase
MLNRDVIPVEGASNAYKVLKYASGERGYEGGGGKKREGRGEEQRGEDKAAFRPPQAKTTEFEALLMKVMEGNRKMRETAKTVTGGRAGINANEFSFYRGGLVIRQN